MTAAEKSFRIRAASATGAKDWPRVVKTYEQYGAYLELIGGDTPAESPVSIQAGPYREPSDDELLEKIREADEAQDPIDPDAITAFRDRVNEVYQEGGEKK